MTAALSRPTLESDYFVSIRDPKNKKIKSINTLHNLNVGVVEKSANLIVSGDSKLLGPSYLDGGAIGALNYPDGSLALIAGTGVNLNQRSDGKVVVDAIVDFTNINSAIGEIPQRIDLLDSDISFLDQKISSLSGSISYEIQNIINILSEIDPRFTSVEETVNVVSSSYNQTVTRITALEEGLDAVRSRASGAGIGVEMNVKPEGEINGQNVVFTLPSTPSPASSLMFFKNGQLLTRGSEADYTLSSTTVTLLSPPEPDDVLSALYTYQIALKSYSINEPVNVELVNGISLIQLNNSPNPPESLMIFMNGQLLTQNEDYSLNDVTVSLNDDLESIEESRFFATYSY